MTSIAHLARRFAGSISDTPPSSPDLAFVRKHLLPAEWAMWERFATTDQRHTVAVARRFVAARPDATRPEIAGALLHDIGKVASQLGTIGRVVATIVGPRTTRFRQYHDHEAIGAEWCIEAGSDPVTVELVRGRADTPASTALRAADNT